MGDRYFLTVKCPECRYVEDAVYYAPTCGFKTYTCRCGHEVDLEEYTGISEADCSNLEAIQRTIDSFKGIMPKE